MDGLGYISPMGIRNGLISDPVQGIQSSDATTWTIHPRKNLSYFPLNPGCLIGILILVYYNDHLIV